MVTGDSAGGHLADGRDDAGLRTSDHPRTRGGSVVNFYGIADVADLLEGEHMEKYALTWVPEQEGRRQLAKRVSPITYVRKDLPPILTLHGDADKVVPYEQSANLTNELKKAGADARLITVSGAGHGFPQATLEDEFEHIFAFLKEKAVLYH